MRDETVEKPMTGMGFKTKKTSYVPQITVSEVEKDVRQVLRTRE